jgi:type VI protein secretion system component Hcp
MHFKQSFSSFLAGGSYGASGTKKPSKSPLVITKVVDIASPFLNIYSLTGKLISDVTLVRVSPAQSIDYRVIINNVMISAIEVDGLDEKGRILENVSLDFAICTWEFHDTKPDGSLGPLIRKKFDFNLMQEIY